MKFLVPILGNHGEGAVAYLDLDRALPTLKLARRHYREMVGGSPPFARLYLSRAPVEPVAFVLDKAMSDTDVYETLYDDMHNVGVVGAPDRAWAQPLDIGIRNHQIFITPEGVAWELTLGHVNHGVTNLLTWIELGLDDDLPQFEGPEMLREVYTNAEDEMVGAGGVRLIVGALGVTGRRIYLHEDSKGVVREVSETVARVLLAVDEAPNDNGGPTS